MRRSQGRRAALRRALRGAAAPALAVVLSLLPRPAGAQIYTRRNGNGVVEATNIPDGDFRLTYPGKGTLIHSRGFHRAYRGEFDIDVSAAASVHNVSPDLVRSVIAAESEFDQYAVSSKGAQGLMQLMPFTARRFGVANPFDARQNIFGGTQYLRFLLDLFRGDVGLAVAGYNAGENAVLRYGGIPPYRETQAYVQKVQSFYGNGYEPASGDRAVFYSPAPVVGVVSSAKPARLNPARPRTYYRWNDERGTTHVAPEPPPEGVVYAMIRALD